MMLLHWAPQSKGILIKVDHQAMDSVIMIFATSKPVSRLVRREGTQLPNMAQGKGWMTYNDTHLKVAAFCISRLSGLQTWQMKSRYL